MNSLEEIPIINFDKIVHTTVANKRNIAYIVIHYTAGVSSKNGTALSTAKYFASSSSKASADFIIDDNNIIRYNCDIENRYTWHCGGSKLKNSNGGSLYKLCTNQNSIGIELCSTSETGKVEKANDKAWHFTAKVLENAISLVVSLMRKYDIQPSNVIRHYDVTGKCCPGIIGWNKENSNEVAWSSFLQAITDNYYASKNTNLSLEDRIKQLEFELEKQKQLTKEKELLASKYEGMLKEVMIRMQNTKSDLDNFLEELGKV